MDRKYTITDHSTGEKYDITEHKSEPDTYVDPNGYPIYAKNRAIPITEAAKLHKQELDSDKLLAEARSLIEYNKREKEKQQQPKQEEPKPRVNEVKRFVRILNNEI